METMRYLMSKILLVVIILILVWAGYLVIKKFFPKLTFITPTHFFTDDWLPDPVNFTALNTAKTANLSSVTNDPWMSPGTSYVEYTGTGMRIINGKAPLTATSSITSGFSPVALYIRKLSIYTNGSLYTGLTFTGEARNTLFAQGVFPIYIVDSTGRIVAVEQAQALSAQTAPGWTKFVVQLRSVLPVRTPCHMIFRAAPTAQAGYSGTQVVLPYMCN